jgi:hypothetical protein
VLVSDHENAHAQAEVDAHDELAYTQPLSQDLAASEKAEVTVSNRDGTHAPAEVDAHDELAYTEPLSQDLAVSEQAEVTVSNRDGTHAPAEVDDHDELAYTQALSQDLAASEEAEVTVPNHDDAHAPADVDAHDELSRTQPFTEQRAALKAPEVTPSAENDCTHAPAEVDAHDELLCTQPFTEQLAALDTTICATENNGIHVPEDVVDHDELVRTEEPAASQPSDAVTTIRHHSATHTSGYAGHELATRRTHAQVNNLFSYDLNAMCATNLLKLVSCNPTLVRSWAQRMILGVPRGARDDLDLAGKLPLCLKALTLGLDPSELMIDCAQDGGVYGRSDGCLVKPDGEVQTIEMKGGICRQGRRSCFMIRNIRSAGVDWKHLFFTGRLRNPGRWDSLEDMENIMYLAYVRRDVYERALAGAGRSTDQPLCASVSPHSRDSWLGRHLKWIRLSRLSKEWWQENVVA